MKRSKGIWILIMVAVGAVLNPDWAPAPCNSPQGVLYELKISDTLPSTPVTVCINQNQDFKAKGTPDREIDGGGSYGYTFITQNGCPSNSVAGSASYGAECNATFYWKSGGERTVTLSITNTTGTDFSCGDVYTWNVKVVDPGRIQLTWPDLPDWAAEKKRLPPGMTLNAGIVDANPDDRYVLWAFYSEKFTEIPKNRAVTAVISINGVIQELNQANTCAIFLTPVPSSTPVDIRAGSDTGIGRIYAVASDSELMCCVITNSFEIGCPSCSGNGGGCEAGEGTCVDECVNVSISLGRSTYGGEAGNLRIFSEITNSALSTPYMLQVPCRKSVGSGINANIQQQFGDMTLVVSSNGYPRQVLVPECMADVVVSNNFAYEILFYKRDDVGGTNGVGLYTNNSPPFVSYLIRNPSGNAEDIDTLQVIQYRSTSTITNEFVWTETGGNRGWELSTGNNLRRESRIESAVDGATNVTYKVMDGASNTVFERVEKYMMFPWGQSIVEKVTDPNGAKLTNLWDYYTRDSTKTGEYSRVKFRVSPDGSWTKYEYNFAGLTTREITPFKDATTNDAETASKTRVTEYSYTTRNGEDTSLNRFDPRTVTETVQGVIVGKTINYYWKNAVGEKEAIVERCSNGTNDFGNAGNLRTTTTYYNPSVDAVVAKGMKSVQYPDGRLDSYTNEFGVYTANADPAQCVFTPGTGDVVRAIVTHGTVDSPAGITNKTTRDVTVTDKHGNKVLSETYVYTGLGYERIQWTVQSFDQFGRVTTVSHSNGGTNESAWGCCGKTWERDESGVETDYAYDALDRNDIVTKQGTPNIMTITTFDADGRTLVTTNVAGGLCLVSSNFFDLAGRTTQTISQTGLRTVTSYQNGGRTTTIVAPGNATNITDNYLDGRAKNSTGNAVVPSFQDYGVNSDGTTWTITYTGPQGSSSAMWQKTTTDMLGRTIRQERPGYGAVVLTNETFYNIKGQVIKTTSPGIAPMLYMYNELGEQVRSGLDVDGNGILDLDRMDRINEMERYFAKDSSNNWWDVSISKLYAKDNDATVVTNSIQKTKLSGLGAGGLVSFVVSSDILRNETVSKTYIDRENKTVTQVTHLPTSTNDSVSIMVNGVLTETRSPTTGASTFYNHDALERQTGVTDPRTGVSITHYNDKGQVDWVQDSATNTTWFSYDPDTGRQIAVTNAMTNAVFMAYNAKGQVVGTWGADYPVLQEFDDYNRKSALYTYRGTNSISSYSEMLNLKSAMDRTAWHYDLATGLLTNKLYADTNGPSYTYTADGKLETRNWARGVITRYSYDPKTGAMTNIDYSDDTPDVFFTLNRIGQQVTVCDVQGIRAFTYNDALQLASETNALGLITRQYDGLGRNSGFAFNSDYSVNYVYSSVGRFSQLSYSSALIGGSNVWNYSYLPNSDLLSGWSNGTMAVMKSYEPNRNLLTQVKNLAGTNLISQFDYQNDALGRRTARVDGRANPPGEPFSVTNAFDYNMRSELISADMNTNNFGYLYDSIGNRISDTSNSLTHFYTANSLNQYTQITNGGLRNLAYDLDGNLTNDSVFSYFWDAENRLIAVENRNGVPARDWFKVACGYDYMSRRISKNVFKWNAAAKDWSSTASKEVRFIYDGWNMIREDIVDRFVPPAGPPPGVGPGKGKGTPPPQAGPPAAGMKVTFSTNYYVWGQDLSGSLQGAGGIGGLLSAQLNNPTTGNLTTVFYFCDGNGNVSQLVDASNPTNVLVAYTYGPFGNIVSEQNPGQISNPFKFSSKYFDSESGKGYWGYRWYDTVTGRWMSRDPLEEEGGVNLYDYCKNSTPTSLDYRGFIVMMNSFVNEFLARPELFREREVLKLGLKGKTPLSDGCVYKASVCTDEEGELQFVQNMKTAVEVTFSDKSSIILTSGDKWIIDYKKGNADDVIERVATETGIPGLEPTFYPIGFSDSPYVPILKKFEKDYQKISGTDEFKLYLLFKNAKGVRTTLGLARWAWSATAERKDQQEAMTVTTAWAIAGSGQSSNEKPLPWGSTTTQDLLWRVGDVVRNKDSIAIQVEKAYPEMFEFQVDTRF